MDEGFSGTQAAKVVGITYRQLDYWAPHRPDPAVADGRIGERQPPPVQLQGPARAARDQDPARRRDQTRVGPRRVRVHAPARRHRHRLGTSRDQRQLGHARRRQRADRRARARDRACSTSCRWRASSRRSTTSCRTRSIYRVSGQRFARPPGNPITGEPFRGAVSPLDAVHRSLGARMVPFGGWDMPLEYTGTIEEHRGAGGRRRCSTCRTWAPCASPVRTPSSVCSAH